MAHAYRKKLEILKVSKCILVIFGAWRNELTEKAYLARCYFLYSCFIHLYMTVMIASMCGWVGVSLNNKNKSAQEMERLITAITYLSSTFVVMIKIFLCQGAGVRRTISFVLEEENKINDTQDEDIFNSHSEQVRFCNSINLVQAICYLFIYVCFAIVENLVARIKVEQYNKVHNETLIKPLIYDLYIYKIDPIKYETFFMFYCYIGAAVLLSYGIATNIILSCIIFGSSVIKALQIKVRKIAGHGNTFLVSMKEYVKEHQQLIRFVEDLNNSLKYIILIEYITTSLTIALVALQFVEDKTSTMRIGRLGYSGSFVVYILSLGWSSNEIKIQTMAMADALYECSWVEQSEEAKRILFIMMMRTNKPSQLTRGPFAEMTLQSAITVLKAAYSYVSIMIK
ncbi:odorant receptor 49b-like [Cylas formicarius]|uniref:odorant receptor 49b-like n=1 Tax=Cylas formicarius TaxID=197179 RepID=UPI002958D171|nr:odorant receptor 49b-like [Cylas formicarius]